MRLRPPLPAALLCLAAASSCGDPLAPLPAEGAPAAFTYETVGFLAAYTTVRLDGGTLVTVRTGYANGAPYRTETRRAPSAAAWRAFWAAADSAGVRAWPARCGDNAEADGGGFRFTLAWAGDRLAGSHVNAFPRGSGRCDEAYTEEARRFEAAVRELTGAGAGAGG